MSEIKYEYEMPIPDEFYFWDSEANEPRLHDVVATYLELESGYFCAQLLVELQIFSILQMSDEGKWRLLFRTNEPVLVPFEAGVAGVRGNLHDRLLNFLKLEHGDQKILSQEAFGIPVPVLEQAQTACTCRKLRESPRPGLDSYFQSHLMVPTEFS